MQENKKIENKATMIILKNRKSEKQNNIIRDNIIIHNPKRD